MRVFVTGSTGFVGSAVVKELLATGHQVLGLTRSEKGIEQLKSQGAEALHGVIEDLEILKKGASECDAVMHLAFNHNFGDFAGACKIDQTAIEAMGSTLAEAGGNRALIITSGTMMLKKGVMGTEDDKGDMSNPMSLARGGAEPLCLGFVEKGVRAMVVRLPPTTHGPGTSGFTGLMVMPALKHGVSAYVGEGQNRWCAGHRDDAAKIYRLALENGKPGSVYHAVGEEGVPVKDIAFAVGKYMNVPVVSIPREKAPEHFDWFSNMIVADNPASSAKTQKELGWKPTGKTVIEDVPAIVEFMKSFKVPAGME